MVLDSYYWLFLLLWFLRFLCILLSISRIWKSYSKTIESRSGFSRSLQKKLYKKVFEKTDKIIIPDYPLPYIVCRKNLEFSPKVLKKLFYSSPLVREKYEEVDRIPLKKPHIVSLIGGFGYREPIFRKVLTTAALDQGINYTLISGPNLDPTKFREIPKNVQLLRFVEDTFPYIKSSDVVIAPGGHSTIMEALSFVPILSFLDEGHSEQENNAVVIEEEGYGRMLTSYSAPSEVIFEYIREVLEEDEKYRNKVERLQQLAAELNGPEAIRELLEKKVGGKVF